MPLIEAQYASEDGHRTARVYRVNSVRHGPYRPRGWRVVFWGQYPRIEAQHGKSFDSLTAAQHAAEAWVGDREG